MDRLKQLYYDYCSYFWWTKSVCDEKHLDLHEQTYTSESESHWVPHSYGLVPHLSKKAL